MAMVALICSLLFYGVGGEPDTIHVWFTPEKVREFADFLFQDGDYLRAAGEYERYLILTGKTENQELLFTIGNCYLLAQQPERARGYFSRIQGHLAEKANYQIARSYYLQGEYRRSLEHLLQYGNPEEKNFITLMLKNHLFLKNFSEARRLVRQKPTGTELDKLTLATAHLRYRSLPVAGVLSAIIPGLGKGYAGRWADALFSFTVIGFTGFQAYDGFRRDRSRSVKGWIYGTLCLGFYVGNIWGSLVAVKQHNRRIEDQLLNQVKLTDSLSTEEEHWH
ncbi:MAG: tetratricopeptide repeat protein [bacterium]